MADFGFIGDLFNGIGAMGAESDMMKQENNAKIALAQQYGQGVGYLSPYQQMGQLQLGNLATNINKGVYNPQFNQVDPSQIANDPGYQFRMQQAQQALQRSAAAGGRLNSGAFMKGMDQYSQGLASQEYNNAFGRNLSLYKAQQTAAQNQYGRLANLVGMGYGAAGNMAGLSQQYGHDRAGIYAAMGNTQAAGDMAKWGYAGQGAQSLGQNMASMYSGGMGGGGGGGWGGGGDVIPAEPMQ